MKKNIWNIGRHVLLFLLFFAASFSGIGQTLQPSNIVKQNPSDQELLDALVGSGFSSVSVSTPGDGLVNGDREKQILIFDGAASAGLGMDKGVLFSTGIANQDISQKNQNLSISNKVQTQGVDSEGELIPVLYEDPDLVGIDSNAKYDVVVYKFQVTLASFTTAIRAEFQFGSEEYPDYVGSQYNDAFGFFVRPVSANAQLPGGASVINMARLPQTNNPISINTVNYGYVGVYGQASKPGLDLGQAGYYVNNGHTTVESTPGSGQLIANDNPGPIPAYIEYNGLTKLLTYDLTGLTPGETYEFKIAIADTSDQIFDSGVIIKQIQGTTGSDVKIVKTTDKPQYTSGEQITFTLEASNLGPYDAANTVVTDLLPSGYTYVSHNASKGIYDENTGIWNIGDLQAIHETVTLKIVATVNGSGDHNNTATIEADGPDPNEENNSSSVEPDVLEKIQAKNDEFDVEVGGGTTGSVLNNDSLNGGSPIDPADVTVQITDPSTLPAIGVTLNPDGTVTVDPTVPGGYYTFTYEVCSKDNPTLCDTAKVGIVVGEVCTEPVQGEDFEWNVSSTQATVLEHTFTQPGTNYGFVLDIFKLDNSVNLNVNGTDIATADIQFQAEGTLGINVEFEDGTQYATNANAGTPGNTTKVIWELVGDAQHPILRFVISPLGSVKLYGAKTSGGELFPLKLKTGTANDITLNDIIWNDGAANTIVAHQDVVGVTTMAGTGYGLNLTDCFCTIPGATDGTILPTKVGITSLGRAGTDQVDVNEENWPMVRKGGYIALESQTKGFVVNRVEFDTDNKPVGIPAANYVEGMMVYDTTNKCLKMYVTSTENNVTTGDWYCMDDKACPED